MNPAVELSNTYDRLEVETLDYALSQSTKVITRIQEENHVRYACTFKTPLADEHKPPAKSWCPYKANTESTERGGMSHSRNPHVPV